MSESEKAKQEGPIFIRELKKEEIDNALELVWNVFLEYEAPDYSRQGTVEFFKSIHDTEYLKMLQVYGAFRENKLVGVIATRSGGTHIALFFVDGKYHKQGIGKKLFAAVVNNSSAEKITVNSSPFAVPIYHRLGFKDTDREQVTNGLRYTPMEIRLEEKIQESIQATREGFEKSFEERTFYNQQTQDETHLQKILDVLEVKENDRILDLGTGSGYLAFSIAQRHPESKVTGLDIVEKALEENRKRALREKVENIEFIAYDGLDFPFPAERFGLVATRYALHHFPRIEHTFQEVSRILKKSGYFFIADPTPNDNDADRFVDDYMRMKKDGHIKYYRKEEFEDYGSAVGLMLIKAFQTRICFPRQRETAVDFDHIMKVHKKEVIDGYGVEVSKDGRYIYITQNVWNLLFKKL